jgi:hypothetical protein
MITDSTPNQHAEKPAAQAGSGLRSQRPGRRPTAAKANDARMGKRETPLLKPSTSVVLRVSGAPASTAGTSPEECEHRKCRCRRRQFSGPVRPSQAYVPIVSARPGLARIWGCAPRRSGAGPPLGRATSGEVDAALPGDEAVPPSPMIRVQTGALRWASPTTTGSGYLHRARMSLM